ncbi:MAG TPA: DUF4915 domain-containing protein [Bacillales bacterium]|nr:DUF4915 domain-containing protein [Bacillales bacterium]
MSSIWLTWDELNQQLKDKEVLLFGAGVELVEKTISKIPKQPLCILDNSKNMQNSTVNGVEVVPPNEGVQFSRNFIILITTTLYQSVSQQLSEMGLTKGVDFFCSPVLYSEKKAHDIKSHDQTLLFSCSDAPEDHSSDCGGGLYTFDIKTRKLEKHFSGRLRQIAKTNDFYYVADASQGVQVFNKNLEFVKTIESLPGSILHGLTYDPVHEVLYTANTGRDSISVIDIKDGSHIEELSIRADHHNDESDQHHINDLCSFKGNLYISMFSFSGLWKEGCFDGGVASFDTRSNKITGYPIRDIWMPHSVDFINGEISVIDSMNGKVYKTSNKSLVEINGFLRGLAFDGKYYFIGQSEHRHIDRLQGVNGNITLNCGIHLYDPITSLSRFHSFDELTNIHSIVVVS